MKFDDKTGRKYGRLTVLKRGPNFCERLTSWVCLCECGATTTVASGKLFSGHTKSCGCFNRDLLFDRSVTHGATIGRAITDEYKIWRGAKLRCVNPRSKSFPLYGGRGIKMCEQWIDDFAQFMKDMGQRPSSHHSIDRIDVNGHYDPGNCRWATSREQAQNTRTNVKVTVNGKAMVLSEAARAFNVSYVPLYKRVVLGKQDPLTAITTLKNKGSYFREHWGG